MKPILYLITNDFPFGNGEASFILPELPYLKEKFDVTIISHSLDDEQTCFLDEDIKVIHYNRKVSLIWKIFDSICYFGSFAAYREMLDIFKSGERIAGRLFESLLFFEEARRFKRFLLKNHVIDPEKPAIVYCYWFTYYCLTMTEFCRKHPAIKVITRAHRYDLYDEGSRYGRQPFKQYMNKWLDAVIFIAEHGRQYYINKYGVPQRTEQYQLFRLGVEPEGDKRKSDKQTKEFLLVSCSVVISRKRVPLIVDALVNISHFDIRWIHFGDGEDFDDLCRYAEERLGEKKNILYELRGYVSSEQIMRFYNENYVDAFITTTASEGCPVSVQEAMAYGIPIIGTAVAEIPYMINGNGVLLQEDPSEQEIAKAIEEIYDKGEQEIIQMREQSYQLWNANFNLDKNATRFVEFLGKLAED